MSEFFIGLIVFLGLCSIILFTAQRLRVSGTPPVLLVAMLFGAGSLVGVPGAPLSFGGDYSYYAQWAIEIVEAWDSELPYEGRSIWPGKGVWSVIIGAIFWTAGTNHYIVLALSSSALGMAVLVSQRATVLLADIRLRWESLIYFGTSAAFVLYGSQLIREPFFWLGISLGVLGVGYLRKKSYVTSALITLTSGALLLLFRPDLGVVVLWGLLGVNILTWLEHTRNRRALRVSIASLGFVALLLSFLPAVNSVSEREPSLKIQIYNEAHSRDRVESAFTPSNPTQEVEPGVSRPANPILETVVLGTSNLTRAFFGPFPYELENKPVWYLASLSTFHFWMALWLAFLGMISNPSSRFQKSGFILMAVGLSILFAATMTNYGSLSRFRVINEMLLAPYALAGVKILTTKVREHFHKPRGQIK